MNNTHLQINCTSSMFILAAIYTCIHELLSQYLCLRCAGFKILRGFMKWALRNKTAEKGLKMAIFKLFVLSSMHTTLFSFFYSNNSTKFYAVWKYKKKFESTTMGLEHFKILMFSDFSSMRVGLEKKS